MCFHWFQLLLWTLYVQWCQGLGKYKHLSTSNLDELDPNEENLSQNTDERQQNFFYSGYLLMQADLFFTKLLPLVLGLIFDLARNSCEI